MAKAPRITVTARVHTVLRLLISGAGYSEVRQYATDQNWKLSERQLRRYMEAANRLFVEAVERNRDQLLGRHLLQRRALYARALKNGDVKTALQVLQDEAALLGLYAPVKVAPTTPDGQQPFRLAVAHLSVEELRALRRVKENRALTQQVENVVDEAVACEEIRVG
jgi:hypothetical protein